MAQKILKEEQRFHALEAYLLLGLFTGWFLYKFVTEYIILQSSDRMSILTFTIVLLVLGGLWWLVYNLRMYISVNNKRIKFRLSPFQSRKHKIMWEDIQSCEFVKTNKVALWSGWGAEFIPGEKTFSLCGRTGMFIETKSGDRYFIGSRKLYKKRQKIQRLIRQSD